MDNSNLKQKTNFLTLVQSENNDQFIGQSKDGTIGTETGASMDSQGVTDFYSEMPSDVITMVPRSIDATYQSQDFAMSNLSTWMSRPRVIRVIPWTVDAVGFAPVSFFPYFDFLRGLNSAALIKKIDNHYLLRGHLVLRFLINGSPFHYGKARAVFRPGIADNSKPANINPRSVEFAQNYIGISHHNFLTTYSQRQGVFIDPGTNQPVEMKLPFMCLKNYIDLRNLNEDLDHLGQVIVYCQNLLRHANGAIDPVSITVFAHMEDVALSTPTASNAFQGESKDEYGVGVISKPASAIAKYAGKLSGMPYIGKFAMATEIGASAVSSISTLWGYAKPIDVRPSEYMRNRPIGGMAHTSGIETIPKLSLDPKQEVSIDPTTVGLYNQDQMALAYIMQRESLLVTFPWLSARNEGDILLGWKVHPSVYPQGVSTLPPLRVHHPTALGWAVQPFAAWRGSIHYRIQVVASANHRGRLLIQYDPNHLLANSSPNMQTRFSQVMDLTECRDITICVNYNRAEMYLPTQWNQSTADVSNIVTGAFTSDNRANSNGILVVSVLNELAAPITTTTVEINVYVKAGDDFVVANPTGANLNAFSYSEATTYAGVINLAGARAPAEEVEFEAESKFTPTADCENEPEQCTYHVINGTSESNIQEDLKKVMYGEQIVSIRSLLRRYNLVDVTKAGSNPTGIIKIIRIDRPDIPAGPGTAYGTSIPTTGDTSTNFCKMSVLRYFMSGYAAYKGAMRYKYIVMANTPPGYMFAYRRVKFENALTRSTTTANAFMNAVADSAAQFQANVGLFNDDLGSKNGSDITFYAQNGSIEFELPWQSRARFAYCSEPVYNVVSLANQAYAQYQEHNHSVFATFAATQNLQEPGIFTYCATGEDFSFFHFINAPVMYVRNIVLP